MPMVKAVSIGKSNTYVEQREITDDLPADVIGECVVAVCQRMWKAGEDPVNQVIVVRFS